MSISLTLITTSGQINVNIFMSNHKIYTQGFAVYIESVIVELGLYTIIYKTEKLDLSTLGKIEKYTILEYQLYPDDNTITFCRSIAPHTDVVYLNIMYHVRHVITIPEGFHLHDACNVYGRGNFTFISPKPLKPALYICVFDEAHVSTYHNFHIFDLLYYTQAYDLCHILLKADITTHIVYSNYRPRLNLTEHVITQDGVNLFNLPDFETLGCKILQEYTCDLCNICCSTIVCPICRSSTSTKPATVYIYNTTLNNYTYRFTFHIKKSHELLFSLFTYMGYVIGDMVYYLDYSPEITDSTNSNETIEKQSE